ncbi:hypothetical protein [Pseudomonas protegens]|uniref:hypothetical protein n=1 Tax=Pseudomonas protegens TaxID=380021 RepID=UPI001E63642E|nr:hypothetical protein [Pseudomonas protegens]MCD9569493.1 hypothetical protein [Pseudomonas protegens]WRV92832.1 hypothetical protein VP719_07295 [Pseudomonas protegens]
MASRIMRGASGQPGKIALEKKVIEAPERICLYARDDYSETLRFFDEFDRAVLVDNQYVELDFSETVHVTAAAALVLFAKVTRCQCCLPSGVFRFPSEVITVRLPTDKAMRDLFVNTGLWAALRPGGIKKLERLWGDWANPFKTGNDASSELPDIIQHLMQQFDPMPLKIVSALQESYLNIAHHAYELFKSKGDVMHPFMEGRWWQYARRNEKTKKINIVIYDMGNGIPASISDGNQMIRDCDSIKYAMMSGVTRLNIQGRGMGFNNIKRPIEVNADAEYLVVYSARGQVIYRQGDVVTELNHGRHVGGTLIEWVFGD